MRRAVLFLALCQVIWSFGGVVIRWSPLPILTLVALALLTSGAFIALATPRRRLALPTWKHRFEAIGFGVANGVTNALVGIAIPMAGIGNFSFAYASLPLWMVIVARPLVGDRVPLRAAPALALGGCGIALLLVSSRGSDSGDQVFLGLLLAIAAAIAGSVSALAGRRLVRVAGIDGTAAWTMLVGGLVLVPFIDWGSLAHVVWWLPPLLLVWVGLHFIFAPLLYNRSSVVAPAFVMAVATFVNPALSPVWGAIFYDERVAPLSVAGLLLALAANIVLLLLLRSSPSPARDEPVPHGVSMVREPL